MTEEAATRILNRLERILEAIDDVNPVEIADHVRSDSMKPWTKSLRDYVYERVEEIESEVQKCEVIVRCKDCKHYRDRINGCAEFGDESRGEFANVEPEGYCAWGERKVE